MLVEPLLPPAAAASHSVWTQSNGAMVQAFKQHDEYRFPKEEAHSPTGRSLLQIKRLQTSLF